MSNGLDSLFYRHYFAKKLDHIIQAEVARRAAIKVEQQLTNTSAGTSSRAPGGWSRRIFRWKSALSMVPEDSSGDHSRTPPKERLRPDMIRRMDAPPKLVNPSGWITESGAVPMKHISLKSNATRSDMQTEERAHSPRQVEFVGEMTHTPMEINLGTDVDVENIHIIDNAVPANLERNTS